MDNLLYDLLMGEYFESRFLAYYILVPLLAYYIVLIPAVIGRSKVSLRHSYC